MMRVYTICHMLSSIDGKVTGTFLENKNCKNAENFYYKKHRELGGNGFICGRVTMEESFTKGYYPNLEDYEPIKVLSDRIPMYPGDYFAVAIDPLGKLGWQSNRISDEDSGYNNARVVEVLTEQVDPRYVTYLEKMEIPYIFVGKDEINIPFTLSKLKTMFGIDTLLLEGGATTNNAFIKAGMVDEISLVVAPLTADESAKSLLSDGAIDSFFLAASAHEENVVWLNYKK